MPNQFGVNDPYEPYHMNSNITSNINSPFKAQSFKRDDTMNRFDSLVPRGGPSPYTNTFVSQNRANNNRPQDNPDEFEGGGP